MRFKQLVLAAKTPSEKESAEKTYNDKLIDTFLKDASVGVGVFDAWIDLDFHVMPKADELTAIAKNAASIRGDREYIMLANICVRYISLHNDELIKRGEDGIKDAV